MLIPVVLSGGKEELVSKDDLQFLLDIQQIMFGILCSLFSSGVHATLVQYTHTGNPFETFSGIYNSSDMVTGYFTVDDTDMVSLGSPNTVQTLSNALIVDLPLRMALAAGKGQMTGFHSGQCG